ncbi:MAG: hypothetical protein H7A41_01050 [Chlamydiales bacterium]|nr:hypothetical protein [Chlamydiales bacterium]
MSIEVIKKGREEEQPTSLSATQGVKGTPSLAVLGIASAQLETLLQVSEKEHQGLGSEEHDEAQTEAEPSASGTQLAQSSGDGKIQFTQKSIFEAAGEMSKIQTQTNNSLENELKNELAIMEAQLKAMQAVEQFWEKFGPAWKQFEEDPSNYDNFEKVMKALEEEYSNDPSMEAQLQEIEQEGTNDYNAENHWHDHGWLYHLFHGDPLSDPHYFRDFANDINSKLQSFAEDAVGNPELFANALLNGESTFQAKIRQLFETIEIIMDIVKILEGSKGNSQTAMFDMEALLMDLEQLQINTNTQKSQQQQQISQETAKNMQQNLKKIQDALKKAAEHHSGGLFGWIKDFFESIAKLFEDIGKAVYYAASGQEDKAKKAFDDLTKGFQIFGKAFADIFNGNFKQGFEELFAAALLTMLLGPAGVALLGTKFGEDMKDMATLVIDIYQAYYQLLAAGALAAIGDKTDASKLMESDKKLGEDMLANPALKVLGDVAMVAIMVAAAVSGQYWLAGIMLVLFVMSESGLMQKMTDAIANSIESDMGGKNSALAKILADVIVIVMITVLSAGAGAAEAALATGVDSAAAVGEEEGIEMVEMAGREAADQAIDEGVDEGSNTVNNAAKETGEKQVSRGVQIAKRAASMGAYGFGSTLGSSTLALDILKDTSKKDSELLAIILELVQVIVAAVTASIGGFTTITQSVGNTARAAEQTASQLTQFASRMQVAATGVAAVSGAAQGGETIVQGVTQKKLSLYQANVQLDEATQNVTDQMIKQTGEELKQLVKGYEELIATAFKTPEIDANAELQALIQA